MSAPERVVIPLQQNLGAPNRPAVKRGQEVCVGTVLGTSEAFVSAPVHSSVSGTVIQVTNHLGPLGRDVLCVLVENDGRGTPDPGLAPPGDWREMEREEIRAAVKRAGMVGLGGATFPTHVKLSPPAEHPIEYVILNGAECEPFLNSDHRLMVEEPEAVLEGMRIIMRAVGAQRGIVAVEDNKPLALERLGGLVDGEQVKAARLPTRYPQGAEKVLIAALLGREVPSGGLPMHVGVVVSNVGTAHAISRYFRTGMPLVERAVTVTGTPLREPANLMVPLGTSFAAAVEECGGFTVPPAKVLMGGPMMGLAQYTLEVPVIKATSGIVALSAEEADYREPREPVCIRCGRCVDACPMGLVPTFLASFAHFGKLSELERLNVDDCIECGCCAYGCPTRNPLVQLIKLGKQERAAAGRRAAQARRGREPAAAGEGGGGRPGTAGEEGGGGGA
jgi:electron transport complex protein RnfC